MRHLEIRLVPLVVGCRFRRQARLVSVNIVVGKLFSTVRSPGGDIVILKIICAHNIIIRAHNIIIRAHDIIIRAHNIIIRAHNIIICAHDIIIRAHDIIIRAHNIIIRAHNLMPSQPSSHFDARRHEYHTKDTSRKAYSTFLFR